MSWTFSALQIFQHLKERVKLLVLLGEFFEMRCEVSKQLQQTFLFNLQQIASKQESKKNCTVFSSGDSNLNCKTLVKCE